MYRVGVPAFSCARFSTSIAKNCCAPRHSSTCSALVQNIQREVTSKQRSAVEVVNEYLEKIRTREERLDSFLTVDEQGALCQVRNVWALILWSTLH